VQCDVAVDRRDQANLAAARDPQVEPIMVRACGSGAALAAASAASISIRFACDERQGGRVSQWLVGLQLDVYRATRMHHTCQPHQ
jgi:hypothetical protein